MKRVGFILLMAILAFAVIGVGCKKNQPVVEAPPAQPAEDLTPIPQTDTTPKTEMRTELTEEQFQTIYFDFDEFVLRPDAKASLDHNFGLLRDYPEVAVRIEGHADERGTVEYNLSLGEKRARAAMEYLTGLGISGNRLTIISYGEERPAAQGSNEDAWSRNRRGEFKITSK